MAILDIRGTHGSGKSYIPHQIIKAAREKPETVPLTLRKGQDPNSEKEGVLIVSLRLAIVGLYDRTCGGCDGIKTADEVCRRTRQFASIFKNVMLEGILVAHTFKRYAALAEELKERNYKFCFLDTPLDVCIKRVVDRRAAKGKTGYFDPKNVEKDYHRIWERLRFDCINAGLTVVILDHRDPLPQIYEELD